jgi:hypothetical protein
MTPNCFIVGTDATRATMERSSGTLEQWSIPMFRELIGTGGVRRKGEKIARRRRVRAGRPSFPEKTE